MAREAWHEHSKGWGGCGEGVQGAQVARETQHNCSEALGGCGEGYVSDRMSKVRLKEDYVSGRRLGKSIGMIYKRGQVMWEACRELSKTQEQCASGRNFQEGCRKGA